MGAVCCADEIQNRPTPIPETITDLPAVNTIGMDAYAKFEASLPFNRTLLAVMNEKIDEADEATEGEGVLSLQALRKALPTAAWAPLNDPSSPLSMVLLSEHFKDASKGTPADKVDVEIIKMYSLLHCVGTKMDKAKAFYGTLQEGGLEAHEQISAGDKDFEPVFDKLSALVTSDIFDLAKDHGGVAEIYDAGECKKLIDADALLELREDEWLEEVYGAQSRLDNAAWLAKVAKGADWLLNADDLRVKLFAKAGISTRH